MSERRQMTILGVLATVFVCSLLVFMLSLNAQHSALQTTINQNEVADNAQMRVLAQSMQGIQKGNRAIGCILGIDPTLRTDEAVAKCFNDQGLTAP